MVPSFLLHGGVIPGKAVLCVRYAKSLVSVVYSFSMIYVQNFVSVVCRSVLRDVFGRRHVQSLVCVKCSL